MRTALVVDDAKVDQRLAGHLLEDQLGLTVIYAADGREALELIETGPPDVVVTDMRMPEMDGLQLMETIQRMYPAIPVVLMTAVGSEELAAEALRKGAACYVPKRHLSNDLSQVVKRLLDLTGVEYDYGTVLDGLERIKISFVLENDMAKILPLVRYLQLYLSRMKLCDEITRVRVGVALQEALSNAIQHGNLGLEPGVWNMNPLAQKALMEKRSQTPPYTHRRVYITAETSRSQAVYMIRDEGEGFNISLLPDPEDPARFENATGRGLCLIHTFMTEVHYNDIGNQVTMIKRF